MGGKFVDAMGFSCSANTIRDVMHSLRESREEKKKCGIQKINLAKKRLAWCEERKHWGI